MVITRWPWLGSLRLCYSDALKPAHRLVAPTGGPENVLAAHHEASVWHATQNDVAICHAVALACDTASVVPGGHCTTPDAGTATARRTARGRLGRTQEAARARAAQAAGPRDRGWAQAGPRTGSLRPGDPEWGRVLGGGAPHWQAGLRLGGLAQPQAQVALGITVQATFTATGMTQPTVRLRYCIKSRHAVCRLWTRKRRRSQKRSHRKLLRTLQGRVEHLGSRRNRRVEHLRPWRR